MIFQKNKIHELAGRRVLNIKLYEKFFIITCKNNRLIFFNDTDV